MEASTGEVTRARARAFPRRRASNRADERRSRRVDEAITGVCRDEATLRRWLDEFCRSLRAEDAAFVDSEVVSRVASDFERGLAERRDPLVAFALALRGAFPRCMRAKCRGVAGAEAAERAIAALREPASRADVDARRAAPASFEAEVFRGANLFAAESPDERFVLAATTGSLNSGVAVAARYGRLAGRRLSAPEGVAMERNLELIDPYLLDPRLLAGASQPATAPAPRAPRARSAPPLPPALQADAELPPALAVVSPPAPGLAAARASSSSSSARDDGSIWLLEQCVMPEGKAAPVTIYVAPGTVSVGRKGTAIVIDDKSVSREHGWLECAGGALRVGDKASRYGTALKRGGAEAWAPVFDKGAPDATVEIRDGDAVRWGGVETGVSDFRASRVDGRVCATMSTSPSASKTSRASRSTGPGPRRTSSCRARRRRRRRSRSATSARPSRRPSSRRARPTTTGRASTPTA